MQPGSRASLLRYGRKTSTGPRRAEGTSEASVVSIVLLASMREKSHAETLTG
jgi:hypothetical protein